MSQVDSFFKIVADAGPGHRRDRPHRHAQEELTRPVRVLVVEDEARMAPLLKRALQEEGHAVDVAADGPEGLWLATENGYEAVVLDVMLPGLDGVRLCRRLRERGAGYRY